MKKILTALLLLVGSTALTACMQQPCYYGGDDDRYEYDD